MTKARHTKHSGAPAIDDGTGFTLREVCGLTTIPTENP